MLKIREAEPRDAESLMELYLEHLTRFPPNEIQAVSKWSELLGELTADPNYHILIGEVDGKAVSSVTLAVIKNLTHNLRPYAVMENVVTHASRRNKGYASALIEHASRIAKESGCYKIMLMTGSKREETLRFYQKCGFDMNDKTGFIMRL